MNMKDSKKQEVSTPQVAKDEIIDQYQKNTSPSNYQPEEVNANVVNSNVDMNINPQEYTFSRLAASVRDDADEDT